MSGNEKPSESDGHEEEESNTDEDGLKAKIVIAVHVGNLTNYLQDLWEGIVNVVTMIF